MISSWFRHCAVCQNTRPPIPWLCHSCFETLKTYFLPPHIMLRILYKFHHCRLIDWSKKNDHFIRKLVNSLKGTYGSPFFKVLAYEFCSRALHIKAIQPFNHILIPCPARSQPDFVYKILRMSPKPSVDHGFYWSQALHEQIGFPMKSVLKSTQHSSTQKRKKLLERKTKIFHSSETISPQKSIIFTDDIVTSGATAMAAYQALNRPRSFMVWSIFWRKFDS